uniref:J domain-containing protein n=1 Tax=Polytomella parva TaxID=51329 RepID=A0A7S0UVL7_9CHLO|mmetsp:Transcript_1851/g.2711  ORF Transcript_1851/g.2711 Transcript_1851/m.2711 type:complete len:394 (+) Transcript_1851:139-1320(+)|eukprot:CAMPEP_0175073726 /NCGR_PEP_ID=MMETSP0052_2-20121109/20779_1 /TAXON_ID=51329 ORGANISM="Polytomella parva, Strain SAG 63-3" /NCGR_SAMPLE_ID=MMETSP0052_2 /ASSEMBLY_ACC=CAM_ASM_000194 /LENGTH=393 /DNA_ID=CAMNT_0016341681 /DNA_START=44 /DNA_END=1225 /DNA_ORIENTATION=+
MAENVANRDEALKCLDIARRAMNSNDLAKAEKFARKAKQLYNSSDVDNLLRKIEEAQGSGPSVSSTPNADQRNSSGASTTKPSPSGQPESHRHHTTSQHHGSADSGTPEQRQLVQTILKAKDFYEILGVAKTATDDDIKRAYKKLALKLHPDKCKAKGSEDAFKAVSKSFSCLSDADKRAYYDRTGYESSTAAVAAQQAQQAGRRTAYADEVDPEEIFNMFFGGGFGPGARVFRTNFGGPRQRRPTANPNENGRNGFSGLLQFLPIIFIILFTFFQNQQQPYYSLQKDGTFRTPLKTAALDAPYYVRSHEEFISKYPAHTSSRMRLERQIESSYGEFLEAECQEERLRRHRIWTTNGREAANNFKAVNCEAYDRYQELAKEKYPPMSSAGIWF